MTQENKPFPYIPVLSVNNKKVKKTVVVDEVEQEVEVPAQEGFNIETRGDDKKFNREFFIDKIQAVVLFDRYELKSKFGSDDFFFSNEFEYEDGKNHVRVYAPMKKEVLFEGDYAEAAAHFDTGQTTKSGYPIKDFDVFAVLYISYNGKIYRFKWKMNQNCNWFDYKKNFDNKEYHTHMTDFVLSQKTAGSNTFWVCELQKGEEVNAEEMQAEKDKALETLASFPKPGEPKVEQEIKVDNIPF